MGIAIPGLSYWDGPLVHGDKFDAGLCDVDIHTYLMCWSYTTYIYHWWMDVSSIIIFTYFFSMFYKHTHAKRETFRKHNKGYRVSKRGNSNAKVAPKLEPVDQEGDQWFNQLFIAPCPTNPQNPLTFFLIMMVKWWSLALTIYSLAPPIILEKI